MLAVLEADRSRVADLEAQILHLERTMAGLRIEKSLAQERLDFYTYPVLTLPNEIVSEIFMNFLPIYPLPPPLTGIYSPTLLTHICRKWREIALSTPSLWRAVGGYGNNTVLEQQASIFDLWLNRSRCCPVSLQFGTGDARLDADILAAVVPHRARWEFLQFRLASVDLLEGPMPLLQHLHLGFSDYRAVASDTFTFRDVPLLHTAIIDYTAAPTVSLPWAQLTSLTLLSVYPREWVPILQQTTNLVDCELHVVFDSDSEQPGPDITLKCLESLTFVNSGGTPATDILETFIVPAIHSLKIPEATLGPNPVDSLTVFLSKSSCEMEQVHVRVTGSRSVPRYSYRKAFPSIRQFSFDGKYLYGTVDEDAGSGDFDSSSIEVI
ncbi:hypothetical protein B0H19DRAFT_1229997 [Mycena capillaripes]|nr:hypothetical protein B0H19DRAFT_1229997 [Mycena capillaripes]